MEIAVTFFTTHFIRLAVSAFVCLYTVRKALRISASRVTVFTGVFCVLFCGAVALLNHIEWLPTAAGMLVMLTALCSGGAFLVKVTREKPAKLIFLLLMTGTFAYLCLSVWNLAYVVFPELLMPDSPGAYTDIAICAVIYAALTPPFILVLSKLWEKTVPLKDAPWIKLCAVSAMFILMYFLSYSAAHAGLIGYVTDGVISIFVTACAFITYWQMISMLVQSTEAARFAERLRSTDNQLLLQAELLKEASVHEGEIRQIRHDMRHHFAALESMLGENANERALKYLREYIGRVEDSVTTPVCKNAVADAVCRRYIAIAGKQNVHTDVAADIPEQPGIADSDLAVLLSNLWENALEACGRQSSDGPYIRLRVKTTGNSLMISMTNSFDGVIRSRTGKDGEQVLLSLKRGGTEEGIGLASIRAIVGRYKGLDEVTYDADNFNVKILLYAEGSSNTD